MLMPLRRATYCRELDRRAQPDARLDHYLAPLQQADTIALYKAALAPWLAWCEKNERCALPACDQDVIAYLIECIDEHGASYPSIARFISALSCLHVSNDCERFNGPELRALLKRQRSLHRIQKAAPLSQAQVHAMIDLAQEAYPPNRAARDAAYFALAYASAPRTAEVSDACWEHVVRTPHLWVINIPRSKGDQRGRGQQVTLRRHPDKRYCPITLLEGWQRRSGMTRGPILCPITRGDHVLPRRLGPGGLRWIVATYAALLDLGPGHTPYSFRRGRASDQYERTGDISAVQETLRHKDSKTSWEYVDRQRSVGNAARPYFE